MRNFNVGRQHRFWRRMLVELSVSKTITQNVESVCPCIQRFITEKHLVFVLYFIILCLFLKVYIKVVILTSGRKLESDSYSYFSCLCSVQVRSVRVRE